MNHAAVFVVFKMHIDSIADTHAHHWAWDFGDRKSSRCRSCRRPNVLRLQRIDVVIHCGWCTLNDRRRQVVGEAVYFRYFFLWPWACPLSLCQPCPPALWPGRVQKYSNSPSLLVLNMITVAASAITCCEEAPNSGTEISCSAPSPLIRVICTTAPTGRLSVS